MSAMIQAVRGRLTNETMADVNALTEMVDIRNAIKRCQVLYDDDVNSIITDINVFLNRRVNVRK